MRFRNSIWRASTACVVAYAFALFAVLTSFAPFPAAAGAGEGVLGFEICHQSGTDPLTPADPSGTNDHCKFCIGSAHAGVAALPRSPFPFFVAYVSALRWTLASEDIAPRLALFGAQPRGPPLPA
jgi:hypothetical protein